MIKSVPSGKIRRRCRGLAWALCLLAFVCVSSSSPASAAPQELSPQERHQVFERVWKEIHDHYYDPAFNGVNWDEVRTKYVPRVETAQSDRDFYDLLNEMTGELHDAHTRFSSPEQWSNSRKQLHVSTGFTADDVEGQPVITSVTPSSSAANQGVEAGMTILSLDGKLLAERFAEMNAQRFASSSNRATRMMIYSRLFAGPPDTTLKLGLRRLDGTMFEALVVRRVVSTVPDVATDVLPLGYAYIRFDGFEPHITRQFHRALTRFRNSPGIVIDLRRNGGGDLAVLLSIAGYFFDKKTLFARDSTRSGKPLTQFAGILRLPLKLYVARSGHPIYSGPVVILVGPRSASSSEVFAAGMQDTQRARIVGSATCGCVLGIAKPRKMKGGGVLEMSEVAWFSPKGRKLEGTGITPDEEILPTATDFQMKRDPALLQAEQVLRQMGGERRIARVR